MLKPTLFHLLHFSDNTALLNPYKVKPNVSYVKYELLSMFTFEKQTNKLMK